MHDYWCDRGYFRIDPVQHRGGTQLNAVLWNYDQRMPTREISRFLNETTAPVARYLRERDLPAA